MTRQLQKEVPRGVIRIKFISRLTTIGVIGALLILVQKIAETKIGSMTIRTWENYPQ